MAVDEDFDDAALAKDARRNAAHGNVGCDEIVVDVKTERVLQHLGHRAIVHELDLLARHDGDDRRGFANRLGLFGGADDRVFVAEQIENRGFVGRGRGLFGCC